MSDIMQEKMGLSLLKVGTHEEYTCIYSFASVIVPVFRLPNGEDQFECILSVCS